MTAAAEGRELGAWIFAGTRECRIGLVLAVKTLVRVELEEEEEEEEEEEARIRNVADRHSDGVRIQARRSRHTLESLRLA